MKFIKDILFFEVSTSGPDVDKDSILQLSALLLDRENLLEKSYFNSYVRVSYLEGIIAQHAKMLDIDVDTMRSSQKIYDVAKHFLNKFGTNVLLATHNVSSVLFLKNGFKKAALPFSYDPHVIDLWTLGYIYTLSYGLKKMPTFNTFVDHFGLKQKKTNDALERVRLETEIFKKIIKEA